ncbi:hypothetical protein D3C81_1257980 [compost metagenome]
MLPDSFDATPSTPIDTGTPASAIARTGAMPLPSRALLTGQCAMPVPVLPSKRISSGVTVTRWANQTSGPSQSWSATNCTGVQRYFSAQKRT